MRYRRSDGMLVGDAENDALLPLSGVKMKTRRKIKRRRSRKLHAVAALRVG